MGNLRSVQQGLRKAGAVAELVSEPAEAATADGVVLPGVGAFPEAMRRIRERGFDELVIHHLGRNRPLLGICLGMQLLFEASSEHRSTWGLGLLQGRVEQLDPGPFKLPQIGWNAVRWRRQSGFNAGLPDPGHFWFANSFAVRPLDPGIVLGSAEYGHEFTAVVEQPPLYGAQFHPEKSSGHGRRLLANFVTLCRDRADEAA